MTDYSSKPPSPRQPQQLAHPRSHTQAVYTNDSQPARAEDWHAGQYSAYPSFSYYPAQPSQAQTPYTAEPPAFQHLSLPPASPLHLKNTASDYSNGSRPSPSGSGGKRPLLADEETNGKKQRPSSNDGVKKEKGPKNCKECRRTKAKCDRVFPCSNCRKKGCAVACPDSDLSCMVGKRLVLASTEQLHERISLLESALFKAHSSRGSAPHPLLSAEFLDIGKAPASPRMRPTIGVDDVLVEKSSLAWASENASPALRRGSSGNGADQMAERLKTQSLAEKQKALTRLPKLMRALPPRDETARRAGLFWSRSGWFPNIIRRHEFETLYEPAAYAPTPENPVSPHKLACVFITLAFATFLDLDHHAADDPIIGEFFDNALACFEPRFFGFGVSVAGVQALGLMALFVQFGWPGGGNWTLLRQMTSAVQQLGLHREIINSRLTPQELDLRRRVFHEAFMLDCILSLTAGQHIAIVPEEVNVRFPSDATPEEEMKYSYMRDNYSKVLQLALRPESHPAPQSLLSPIESILMQYDKKACPALHCIGWVTGLIPEEVDDKYRMDVSDLNLCGNTMSHYKALGFLHRPMLRRIIARVRPLLDTGYELSDYEKHVIRGSYEAAEAISVTSSYLYRTHPKLCQRLWFVWVQAFSALVTITAIATFIPGSYPAAHIELTRMVGYFSAAGPKSQAAELLPLVQQLRVILARRHPNAVNRHREQLAELPGYPDLEGEDMLFALLGGTAPSRAVEYMPAPHPYTATAVTDDYPYGHQQQYDVPAYTEHPAAVLQAMPAAAWLERAQYFYEPTPYRADIPAPPWNLDYSAFV